MQQRARVSSYWTRRTPTHLVAEGGIAVALSVALSALKLFQMPQGGSVSLEMVPLFVLAARWGVWPGIVAGAASGLLQMAFGGYVVHWAQALLDYPVAFGVLGIAGAFRSPEWGVAAGSLGRLAAHWLSGIVFFASYAPAGQPVALYSLVYNVTYLVPEAVVTVVVVWALRTRTELFRRVALPAG
ncbi:energy-coupled thiamine transporter ThiT [Carboxydochorda subterranea]|uniref:Energy-coupled thiamine transporter ThiT n=1 Tax=Carboxydichorda subterranea TaxID=3109565 RepID=A0ABZ1BZ35_9FIRM|nr:energy-coupled thiamine transporter ThiT [Limnochorda sp. L945t]WRP17989.1 energy-coupled thiamine transporter ThiT [Limnochorda sp. L945t]